MIRTNIQVWWASLSSLKKANITWSLMMTTILAIAFAILIQEGFTQAAIVSVSIVYVMIKVMMSPESL